MPVPLSAIRPQAAGFTLIELLVVVAVMSSVALLAFGVTTEDRAQLRYNDTRARLGLLDRAILGRLGSSDAATVGGFVADNGELPTSLAQLLAADAGWRAQATASPVFDPVPDSTTCENNGGSETTLTDSVALLTKGHRANYLGGAAFNGRFRDGWGNESSTKDTINFGWEVESDSNARSLTITSLGADNTKDGSDFAADVARTIAAGEWLVPIAGWTITVANYSGDDIAAKKFSASLLVFHNDKDGGHWRRYSTPSNDVCLGAYSSATTTCTKSLTLSFPAGCSPSVSVHDKIPQGRHLLLLVEDSDGVWDINDKIYYVSATTKRLISAQVTAIAGMALPAARLEIR